MTDKVTKTADEVKLIVFACEAGMGSSLMGANQLKKLVKKAKLDVDVIHAPVSQIPDAADVIVTHKGLAAQAKAKAPDAAVVPFMMFFNDPAVLGVVEKLKSGQSIVSEL
jgi:mannitol-specific phosphotransferase system IIBC component